MSRRTDQNSTKTTAWKIAAVVFAAIFVISTIFFFIELWEKDRGEYIGNSVTVSDDLSYNGKEYKLKDDIETILLLGLDKFENEDSGYNNDKQADFLMLLVIDNSAETCKAIHINRDTMTDMDVLGVAGDKIGTVYQQIALSHTYGNGREVSCRNTANAVSGLLMGMEIDHYVSVTMEAVPVYNDLVGGVSLEILDDFSNVDPSMVKGTKVRLTGEQALRYVRSRYGMDDPTNINRMKRQKQYLEALYDRSVKLQQADESFIQRAALKITDYIVSDCSANRLESLLKNISEYEFDKILTIDGESVRGESYMEFYLDEASVEKIVVDCFYKVKD